jgi:restriction endonuclease S subunit
MRIKLINYNPYFAYFYFRTEFFQHLIYTHKKGLGNNTNIFPSQIEELPMLDISLTEQGEIVNEIEIKLAKQLEIKNKIAGEKAKIDKIIENATNHLPTYSS